MKQLCDVIKENNIEVYFNKVSSSYKEAKLYALKYSEGIKLNYNESDFTYYIGSACGSMGLFVYEKISEIGGTYYEFFYISYCNRGGDHRWWLHSCHCFCHVRNPGIQDLPKTQIWYFFI